MSNENKGLPFRDVSKPAEQQGMFRKFDVYRYDGEHREGGKHHGCRYFVLDLTHDQHAPAAMRAYASDCRATHPLLADDIEAEHGPALTEVGILKACIAQLQADADRFKWLCEDHDDANVRKKRNELLERMAVMSYSAASRDIDYARGVSPARGLQPCQQDQCCYPPSSMPFPELSDDLRDILGRPNFTCIGISQRLREMGHSIPRRAEHEQAAVIHLLLSHYFMHGAAWRETVTSYLSRTAPDDPAQGAPAAPVVSSDHGSNDGTTAAEAPHPAGDTPR